MPRRLVMAGISLLSALSVFALACSSGGSSSDSNAGGSATQAATKAATQAATTAATTASGGGTTINATEADLSLKLDKNTASAGTVNIAAKNTGSIAHEVKIIKSDLAEDKLPQKDGVVDESQVQVVAKTAMIDSGKSATATATLAAGKYIVICNVPAHYGAGMHAALTVQ